MKDLIISYNDSVGFYCEEFSNQTLFHKVLLSLVSKYDLKSYDFEGRLVSDIELYFSIRDLNKDKFNIELREEDGSEWIYGWVYER